MNKTKGNKTTSPQPRKGCEQSAGRGARQGPWDQGSDAAREGGASGPAQLLRQLWRCHQACSVPNKGTCGNPVPSVGSPGEATAVFGGSPLKCQQWKNNVALTEDKRDSILCCCPHWGAAPREDHASAWHRAPSSVCRCEQGGGGGWRCSLRSLCPGWAVAASPQLLCEACSPPRGRMYTEWAPAPGSCLSDVWALSPPSRKFLPFLPRRLGRKVFVAESGAWAYPDPVPLECQTWHCPHSGNQAKRPENQNPNRTLPQSTTESRPTTAIPCEAGGLGPKTTRK